MCLARHLFKIVLFHQKSFKGTFVGLCTVKSPLQDVINKRRDYLKAFCFYLVQQLQLFLHNRFVHSLVTEVNDCSLFE